MCVIIYKPRGIVLGKKTMKKCWMENNHGAGLMYHHNGKLIVSKGFFNFNDLWDSYRSAVDETSTKDNVFGGAIGMHFRTATSGIVNDENCHPFWFDREGRVAVMHNGVLSSKWGTPEICDTQHFISSLMAGRSMLGGSWILDAEDNEGREEMEKLRAESVSSRWLLMDAYGQVRTIGGARGVWSNDLWFSNLSWQTQNPRRFIPKSPFDGKIIEKRYGQERFGKVGKITPIQRIMDERRKNNPPNRANPYVVLSNRIDYCKLQLQSQMTFSKKTTRSVLDLLDGHIVRPVDERTIKGGIICQHPDCKIPLMSEAELRYGYCAFCWVTQEAYDYIAKTFPEDVKHLADIHPGFRMINRGY